MTEVGKKYTERNLRYMRQFYELFENQNWNTMCSNLSWSHYREMLRLKNVDEIKYYISICEQKNLSQRQLHDRIQSHEYDRLTEETKKKIINNEQLKVTDLVPNPFIIKVDSLDDTLTEYVLNQAIINNLDEFLFQLGNYFAYVGNEYKIKIGDRYNYIDLLLYNYEYNAFVVVELKVTELKKETLDK